MKLTQRYDVVVTGSDLQKLIIAFKLAGYRDLPANVSSRHDGNYSVWGTSHVMARVMFEMLGLGLENRAYSPRNTMERAWKEVDASK